MVKGLFYLRIGRSDANFWSIRTLQKFHFLYKRSFIGGAGHDSWGRLSCQFCLIFTDLNNNQIVSPQVQNPNVYDL